MNVLLSLLECFVDMTEIRISEVGRVYSVIESFYEGARRMFAGKGPGMISVNAMGCALRSEKEP